MYLTPAQRLLRDAVVVGENDLSSPEVLRRLGGPLAKLVGPGGSNMGSAWGRFFRRPQLIWQSFLAPADLGHLVGPGFSAAAALRAEAETRVHAK